MRLLVEEISFSGWHGRIRLRIPLDEPPPASSDARTPGGGQPTGGLSSKDRLRPLGVDRRGFLPHVGGPPERGGPTWPTPSRSSVTSCSQPYRSTATAGQNGQISTPSPQASQTRSTPQQRPSPASPSGPTTQLSNAWQTSEAAVRLTMRLRKRLVAARVSSTSQCQAEGSVAFRTLL